MTTTDDAPPLRIRPTPPGPDPDRPRPQPAGAGRRRDVADRPGHRHQGRRDGRGHPRRDDDARGDRRGRARPPRRPRPVRHRRRAADLRHPRLRPRRRRAPHPGRRRDRQRQVRDRSRGSTTSTRRRLDRDGRGGLPARGRSTPSSPPTSTPTTSAGSHRADGDGWAPTFPNARHLVVATELAHWTAHPRDERDGAYLADSVAPLLAAGLVDEVGTDHELTAEIRLVPDARATAPVT